jgi:hypothetical protein
LKGYLISFKSPVYPRGICNVNLYTHVLEELGRGPEVPAVTTQEEFDAYFTAMVLDDKETRGRVFLPRNYVSRRSLLRAEPL